MIIPKYQECQNKVNIWIFSCLLFAKWRISLFCGLWDWEQNLDREIVLVAVCGYCVQFQEVAASEEGRPTQAPDWSMVRMEASHWSPGRGDYPGDSGCGGSRPQRPSWWRMMIILSLSITGASHFRHPDPDTGARQMTSNTELWLVNADHVTWILSSDWFTGARQMTTWTRLSNSSPALTLCCYWTWNRERAEFLEDTLLIKVRWPWLFGRKYF